MAPKDYIGQFCADVDSQICWDDHWDVNLQVLQYCESTPLSAATEVSCQYPNVQLAELRRAGFLLADPWIPSLLDFAQFVAATTFIVD